MREIQLLFAAVMLLSACGNINNPSGQHNNSGDSDEYEFVEDTSQWVMVIRGQTESIGKLDAAGNFLPDKGWLELRKGQPLSSVPFFTRINKVHKGAYEFRSGRLIPGDIDKDGNF